MCKESDSCYMCERRQSGCHSSCEDYKAYKQARAERAAVIRKKRAEEAMCKEVHINSIKRITKDRKAHRQSAWKG